MTEHNYYLINAINTHNKRSFTSYHLDGFNYEQTFKYSDTPPIILTEQNLKRDYNENKKNYYNIALNISRRNYINQVEFIELKYKEFENNNFSFYLKIDLLENRRSKNVITLEKSKDEPLNQDDLDFIKPILEELNKISQEEKRILKSIDNTFPDDYHYSFFNGASVDLEITIKNSLSYQKKIKDLPFYSDYKKLNKSTIITAKALVKPFTAPLYKENTQEFQNVKARIESKKGTQLYNYLWIETPRGLNYFLKALLDCIVSIAEESFDKNNKDYFYISDIQLTKAVLNPTDNKKIKSDAKIVKEVARGVLTLMRTLITIDFENGDAIVYQDNSEFNEFTKEHEKITFNCISAKRLDNIQNNTGQITSGFKISIDETMIEYIKDLKHFKTIDNYFFKNPRNATPLTIALNHYFKYKITQMPFHNNTRSKNLINRKIKLIEKAQEKTIKLTQDIKLLESELNNSDIFTDTETLKNELMTKKRKTVKDLLKGLPEYKKALEFQESEKNKNALNINFATLRKELNIDIKKNNSKFFNEDLKPLLEEYKKELIIEDYELVKKGRVLNSIRIKIF